MIACQDRRLATTVAHWLRFAAVGATNTLVSWCAYALLFRMGLHYLLASALAFALGVANSYVLNRRWTDPSTTDRPAIS
jgi:putative flippase GtrA